MGFSDNWMTLSFCEKQFVSGFFAYKRERDVKLRRTYDSVLVPPFTAQILLSIYNQSFPSSQFLLKQGIARCERNTVVSAFNNEIYVSEHGFHLVQTCTMVSKEVGSRKGIEGREDPSRRKGSHHMSRTPVASET